MGKVEYLKKISISFEAGTTAKVMDLKPKYPKFEFIFGVSASGLTPFEYELINGKEGDTIIISLKKSEMNRFFGHLSPPLMDLFESRNDIFLTVRIARVAPAENREIVKALAELANREGCGGGCGCGCDG